MTKVLVASTTIAFKCGEGQETAWLRHAELMEDECEDDGIGIEWFVSLELDARGREPFKQLEARMKALGGTVWTYSVDDLATEITTSNRLHRICMGRNLAIEKALRDPEITHIYWSDSDVLPPPDILQKLLELKRDVCGAMVGIYGLDGPTLKPANQGQFPTLVRWARSRDEMGHHPDPEKEAAIDAAWKAEQAYCHENPYLLGELPDGAVVHEHWNTAGSLLVSRAAFTHVTWHYDPDAGLSDDPGFQRETRNLFGETWVRHDVQCQHVPIPMVAIEDRGHDLRIAR